MPITHAFTSAKSDGADTTLVRASNWNAAHTMTDVMQLIARKTSDQSVTSSTVAVNDTALVAPVAASSVWWVHFIILYTGNNAADISTQFTFPTGGTIALHQVARNSGGSLVETVYTGTTSPSGNGTFDIANTATIYVGEITGVYTNGGTAGNLTLQWAQAVSNATATTVKANSSVWGAKLV